MCFYTCIVIIFSLQEEGLNYRNGLIQKMHQQRVERKSSVIKSIFSSSLNDLLVDVKELSDSSFKFKSIPKLVIFSSMFL